MVEIEMRKRYTRRFLAVDRRLGHLNFQTLKHLHQHDMVHELPKIQEVDEICKNMDLLENNLSLDSAYWKEIMKEEKQMY